MSAVAIVGSRRWTDYDAFCQAMPDLSAYNTLVSGGAKGVDEMTDGPRAFLSLCEKPAL